MRKKKRDPNSVSALKTKAWDLLSLIVRWTGADEYGQNFCVTCYIDTGEKKWIPIKRLQAGHFQSGRGNTILFDERGIRCQCDGCNRWKQGNQNAFRLYLDQTIGKEAAAALAEELHTLSRQTKTSSAWELKERIEGYEQRLKDMGVER